MVHCNHHRASLPVAAHFGFVLAVSEFYSVDFEPPIVVLKLFWILVLSPRVLKTPPNLVLSTTFINFPSIPPSKPLINIFNRIGTSTDTCRIPLEMPSQIDRESLITTCWVQFFHQLFIHLLLIAYRSYFLGLLYGNVMWNSIKSLTKIKPYNIHCFPLPTASFPAKEGN